MTADVELDLEPSKKLVMLGRGLLGALSVLGVVVSLSKHRGSLKL